MVVADEGDVAVFAFVFCWKLCMWWEPLVGIGLQGWLVLVLGLVRSEGVKKCWGRDCG